jgi:hypothetical protein
MGGARSTHGRDKKCNTKFWSGNLKGRTKACVRMTFSVRDENLEM